MAGYSSRSDQLWNIAQQLVEDETKSIPFKQQEEEHGHRIQAKYNQLVSNLSCLGDIIAMMYQDNKLTPKEFEQIQHLQSTPIRANEQLLSIIARKPRDVYESFLSNVKDTNQLHLFQMLASGDDTCDKAKREGASYHKDLICRNFMWLTEKLDTESELIYILYQKNVLTVRERECVSCTNTTFQKNELLLGLLSKKSPEDFEKFLEALKASGQGHLAKKLRKPENSPANPATAQSAVSTPKSICKKLLPKEIQKSRQKPVPARSFSKPVLPPKTLPKPGQKLIPSRCLSKPVPPPKPGTQSTSTQHHAHTVARTTEKAVNFRRTEEVKFQARLKGLESHLQTDIAIKITSVYLVYLAKPEDSLKMYFHTSLQECHHMREEIVARNDETNMELEHLRKSASQYSAAVTLNEVFRAQLNSMQQELTSERFLSNKKHTQLEEEISKLKSYIDNEKTKCKLLEEEKLLNNTVTIEMEDRLKKVECDKQFFQQQMHEINNRLASTECELQKTKEHFEESNSEVISLRTENEKLNQTCEISRKGNEIRNDLEVQLLHTQENSRDLLKQLNEMERSLEVAEEEKLELIKRKKDTMEENSLENDRLLKLQEELDREKHQKQELEHKLTDKTAQLEQLTRKLEGRDTAFVTKESHVIRSNHQFLLENIKSSHLVELLHEKHCITDEERDHLKKQTSRSYINDALLQWMGTIPFEEDKGQMVLECFRQTEQNFVADVLEKGGVLVKSMVLAKLVKQRLFVKSSSKNVEELKEKVAIVIERLNQVQGLSLSDIQNLTSEIPIDDIVIAPYCHQVSDGIVIWFWCQANNGQNILQGMLESGMLLNKLIMIFKEFSNDSVSSTSKVLVPLSIVVYDFTMDGTNPGKASDALLKLQNKEKANTTEELVRLLEQAQRQWAGEKEIMLRRIEECKKQPIGIEYTWNPILIRTIKTEASQKRGKSIKGIALLNNELFIVSHSESEVEVYDSTTFEFRRRWQLIELSSAEDAVSCVRNRCLYISNANEKAKEIFRVDSNGNLITKWQTNSENGRLSVTEQSTVILVLHDSSTLKEFSADGQLINELNLVAYGVIHPMHAIRLTNGNFVVTQGYLGDPMHKLCEVDTDGKVIKSFGSEKGSGNQHLHNPTYLAIDREGSIMVADAGNGRVVLLGSNFEFKKEIVSKKDGVQIPGRIRLDELNGRLHVGEYKTGNRCLLVYGIK